MCPGRFGPEFPKRAVRVVCERQAREGGACGVQTRACGVQTRARGRRNRGEVVLDLIPGGRAPSSSCVLLSRLLRNDRPRERLLARARERSDEVVGDVGLLEEGDLLGREL